MSAARLWAQLAVALTLSGGVARAESLLLVLDRAEFAHAPEAPQRATDWHPVMLPDDWRKTRPTFSGTLWYRIRFTLPAAPTRSQAVYLPRVALTGEFSLNGRLLNPGVRFGMAPTRHWNRPLYFVLPAGLVTAGENELLVRVQGFRDFSAGLATITVGPEAVLSGWYQQRYLLQVAAPLASASVAVVVLFFALTFYVRTRSSQLLLVSLACLLQAPRLLLPIATQLPLPHLDVVALTGLLHLVGVFFAVLALEVFVRPNLPRWRAMCGWTFSLAVVLWLGLWLAGSAGTRQFLPFGVMLILFFGTAGGAVLLDLHRRGLGAALALGLAGLSLSLAGWSYDALQRVGATAFEAVSVGPVMSLPAYFFLLWVACQRFLLDHASASRAVAAAQQIAYTEARERMLADMHDGLGAQLITTIRRVRRGGLSAPQVASELTQVLDELRLIIDSRDIDTPDLLPLLAGVRERMTPRLAEIGITLSWELAPATTPARLSGGDVLALVRIVQEAIHNAVKHAGAGVITVRVQDEADALVIDIRDDGVGIPPGAQSGSGRYGLANMRKRAQQVAATFSITSAPGQGTLVRVRVGRCANTAAPGTDVR